MKIVLFLILSIVSIELIAMNQVILKLGNSHLVAAFFDNEVITDKLRLEYQGNWLQQLSCKLSSHPNLRAALIGSVNSKVEKQVSDVLKEQLIPYIGHVSSENLSINLKADNPKEVGADLIANVYGALKLYPNKNIIVVDIGTAVTFSVIKPSRTFLGAVIMPGLEMGAFALEHLTDKLPLVDVEKPRTCLGTNSIDCISSGIYYGLLGAIDKILLELKNESFPNEDIIILLTGGVTTPEAESSGFIPKTSISKNLQKDLTANANRRIEQDLTLVGFAEILKEQLQTNIQTKEH
ncbi:MAG: type III pantothenate kinase [Chlamydiales bacterium]|nr:type III pantothenate kinase [Chlamydiales bacterium]